jgi:hypothetical protein
MRTKLILQILGCGMTILISSCSKTETPGNDQNKPQQTPDTTNLITNSSFEINGEPSLAGWELLCSDIKYTDASPGGGKWAICMPQGWLPANNYIMTTVSAPIGTNEYKLSYYGKVRGGLNLYIKKQDSLIFCNRIYTQDQDTIWRYYSVLDTLKTLPGDSLVVKVIAGSAEVGEYCYFDLCKLELIK